MNASRIPAVLSIAGSDSGGGAGIQADLKAFARCGVHGMTAVTALTAQNTVGVTRVEPVSAEMIVAQIQAVVDDIGVDAVKVGMIGTVEAIAAVAAGLDLIRGVPVVVDPVMVAESGADLLESDARSALIEKIISRATVVTPNIPEARRLTGLQDAEQVDLARALLEMGPRAVVVTGGHSDRMIDVFAEPSRTVEIPGPRHKGGSSHGSGCTHSSCLAAMLARGEDRLSAARAARELASASVANGIESIGHGPGPVDVIGLGTRQVP